MQLAPLGRIVVLVAEDEFILRMNAAELLSDAGFMVVEAADGREAMSMLVADQTVSVLFTDINMPGEPDGLELAREAVRRRPALKVIVTSGRPLPSPDGLPPGGRFLAKPYDFDEVVDLVRTLATEAG